MSLLQDIKDDTKSVLYEKWDERDGYVVPVPQDLKLSNDAVKLNGAVLYADLAESTQLVDTKKRWFAAEIYKIFLRSACRVITANGGEITAFDGDRVMAVFIGDNKESEAAITGLKINYVVKQILNPMVAERYSDANYSIQHCVGIDASDLYVARTGIRGSNDLVWVGPSANHAAKLCSLREAPYSTWVSAKVFNELSNGAKYGGENNSLMWEARTWNNKTVYRSSWRWSV